MINAFARHRILFAELVKRDVLLRYRGAFLGLVWALLNPLIMLGIYGYAFGYIFQLRNSTESSLPYALNLYCGLITFNVFGETVSRAPMAVRSYPNYIKKIVFPVTILPAVPLGSALLHAFINLLILTVALACTGHLSVGLALYPLLIVPVVLFALGLAWLFAASGVFVRDIVQIAPVLVQVALFLTPVLYPSSSIPEVIRPISNLNPLAATVEAQRAAILGNTIPWMNWGISCMVGIFFAVLGYRFFEHSRDEFADVM